MSKNKKNDWLARAERVANAPTNDFAELIKMAGLDPRRDLRFADWSSVSFQGLNLAGYDFTGARLIDCDFNGANLAGAIFKQVEIDRARPYTKLKPNRTSFHHALGRYSNKTEMGSSQQGPSNAGGYLFTDVLAGGESQGERNRQSVFSRLFGTRVKTDKPSINPESVDYLKDLDEHLPIGAVFKDEIFSPEMVIVPSGNFVRGLDVARQAMLVEKYGEAYGRLIMSEAPTKNLSFGEPFAVGRFPVTVEEWMVFASQTKHKAEIDNSKSGLQPITYISWNDAIDYVEWLRVTTGRPYRLLTEDEWEYCCRAGTSTCYCFGDEITGIHAHFSDKISSSTQSLPNVGLKPSNAWGLHDVHGGVWEWCRDDWSDLAGGGRKVLRGGSVNDRVEFLRSSFRTPADAFSRKVDIGFRVARSLLLGGAASQNS